MDDFRHEPVLRDRVVELLEVVPPGLAVDATVGGGGHSAALLDAAPQLQLLGLDQDADAVAAAREALARFGDRAVVEHRRFDEIAEAVRSHREVLGSREFDRVPGGSLGNNQVVAVLFDLGVSSPQLDRADRGFSFRQDGPLDMRMDRSRPRTAADVVNGTSARELASVLRAYGDERFASRIANAVVEHRPITTTAQLAEVVANAIPAPARRKSKGHPARRSFQAIRIEVNQELDVLADALDQAIAVLQPGGRCVAMSYHSGEDRIVKERFRKAVTGGCICPPTLPCVCGAVPTARFAIRGAQKASPDEIAANPRAESVRLRAIEAIEVEDRAS